jgi:hypothetical protein
MKTLIIMLIAGIVLLQPGISAATSSENSAARDLAAAKSLAFGGVGDGRFDDYLSRAPNFR